MKPIIFSIAFAAFVITSCDDKKEQPKDSVSDSDSSQTNKQANGDQKPASSNEVVAHYLHLKNALVNDDGKEAAAAAKAITASIQQIDEASLMPEKKQTFVEIRDGIKEHAEHIGSNGDKIEHQREHFDMLSKDMYDLVKAFGTSQTLYNDHCPMYNDGKGATWLSESKEIKNPYYGKKMSDCGTVKEEIKE